MNYYNPYFYTMPTSIIESAPKVGLLSRIFGRSGITFSSILNGTQKILNVANQAIPLVKQARPMVNNAKTMFRIMNEFKRSDAKQKKKGSYHNQVNTNNTNNTTNTSTNNEPNNYQTISTGPTFFA